MSIVERVNKGGQTYSMELILFPLLILIIVGVLANNYSSGGIETNPALPLTCQQLDICFPTNQNGCDANKAVNCNITSATTFSFLNPNSPFTELLTGNIPAFINSFAVASTANIATSQPFQFFPNATSTPDQHPNDTSTSIFAICGNVNGTIWTGPNGGSGGQNIKLQCDHVFTNSTAVPNAESKLFLSGSQPSLNCTSFNSDITNPPTPFVYYGCDTIHPFPSWAKYMIVALNATDEKSANGFGGVVDVFAYILLTNQQAAFHSGNDPNYCALIVGYGGSFIGNGVAPTPLCHSWGAAINAMLGQSNKNAVFSGWVSVGFVAGLIFLILALGISLNIQIFTNGLGLGADDQGTKLMQALGIGLVVWTFIYSEFSFWLFQLSNNLGTIGFFTLAGMFFMGLYWRLFTLD